MSNHASGMVGVTRNDSEFFAPIPPHSFLLPLPSSLSQTSVLLCDLPPSLHELRRGRLWFKRNPAAPCVKGFYHFLILNIIPKPVKIPESHQILRPVSRYVVHFQDLLLLLPCPGKIYDDNLVGFHDQFQMRFTGIFNNFYQMSYVFGKLALN